jgi:hypothetical protein
MKTGIWIIIIVIFLILCVLLSFFLMNRSPASSVVGIYKDGVLIQKIDLEKAAGERSIDLYDGDDYNIIIAGDGEIYIKAANCRDQVCVRHKPLRLGDKANSPIICLPNRVVIKFLSPEEGLDAIA